MRQGIVMEIKNKKAILLTKDGSFESVPLRKDQHVEIGSEIIIPITKNYFNVGAQRIAISIIAVAAVFLLLFSQFSFLKQNNLAVAAFVTVDINPSLEVGVDEKLNILEVVPLNKDGQKIMDQLQDIYKNHSLSEFIKQTVELAKKDGYLKENNDLLLTTTIVNKNATNFLEENLDSIKKDIEGNGIAVKTLKGDKKTRKAAKDLGVSTGKYLIYKESNHAITIKDTKDLSVTQIYEKLEKIDKNKKDAKSTNINNQNVIKEINPVQAQPNLDKQSNNKKQKEEVKKKSTSNMDKTKPVDHSLIINKQNNGNGNESTNDKKNLTNHKQEQDKKQGQEKENLNREKSKNNLEHHNEKSK